MKKKSCVLITTIIFLCIVVINFFAQVLPSIFVHINYNTPSEKFLNMSEEIFYRQTYNNCAPYSIMAVINILKNETPNPEVLAKQTPYRIRKNLTYPLGIPKQLSNNNIKANQYVLWLLNDQKKILWLKTQITSGSPVILLVGIEGGVRHYVTVLGYDEKGFMLYDSYQHKSAENPKKTIDDNNLAGNSYWSYEDLLNKWSRGGYKIFFKYWAVSSKLK